MAEKKSTTRKRTVKKVEEPKPENEIQQAPEQVYPQDIAQSNSKLDESKEINWNIVGLFSALFPLVGTGILFMLGWAYEVNWYGYFGVSMSQVSVAPQSLIIQSVPAVYTLLVSIVLAVLTYYFLNTTFGYFRRLVRTARKEVILDQMGNNPKSFAVLYDRRDWLFIYFLTLLFLFFLLWISNSNLLKPFEIIAPYEIYYLQFLFLFSLYGSAALIVLSIVIFLVLFAVATIVFLKQRRLKKMVAQHPFFYKRPQMAFLVLAMLNITVMALLALSASFGINDAAKGYRGSGGWNVQKVLVNSPIELILPNSAIVLGCYKSNCVYGPFGLIGENDSVYILIEWQKDKDGKFIHQPGLYIIPRNDSTYLVPAPP